MTVINKQSAVQALPDPEYTELERGCPPVSLYLAGTVVVIKICATVLSLMA
jgi:hypothetical protein